MKEIKQVIVDWRDVKSIEVAEAKKEVLENLEYELDSTTTGIYTSILTYKKIK